jgi:crotonobetainyl-CoA:carnitine CoA-transferase CaiB-like acyl-CoA transferase
VRSKVKLLSGYRVLESSMLLNGATTGMMLVDLGAEVIKIESPFLGDYLRVEETAHMNLQANKGKRSIALDMRKDEARRVFARLLQTADVFLTNAVADHNDKIGLGYSQLKEHKPNIVYCQNTGFGASGPYAHIPVHGQMMDALAGALPVQMYPDGLVGPSLAYGRRTGSLVAGGEGTAAGAIFAAFHIAAALAYRERTGEGCYIDVSSAEAVVMSAWTAANIQLNAAEKAAWWQNEKNLRPVARYQNYQTKDGKFILFCPEEKKFWECFCDLVGRDDLKKRANGEDLRREIQRILSTRTRDEWMALAVEHRLPIGPVHDGVAAVKSDPQIAARGQFFDAESAKRGAFTFIGQPALVDGTRSEPALDAPELGQHTAEILRELHYDGSEIEALAAGEITTASRTLHDHISDRVYGDVPNSRDLRKDENG